MELFRKIALLEGASYLFLLFFAMPLKYNYKNETLIYLTGWIHGFLFMAYCILLVIVWWRNKWSFSKAAFAFFASLVPFGTFYLDRKLKRE